LSPPGTTFFNYSTIIKDVPPHAVKFKFSPGKQNISKVQSLLQDYTSGFFTVSGLVHLLGEPHHPNNSTKLVCDATITDDTGVINLSIWEEHIPQILNGHFYTITNLKLRFYQEKCLVTTTTTTVSPAEKQNLSQVKPQPKNNCLCCPKILNIDITVYPVCNNNSCKKKLDANPGTRLLRCLKCTKSMLLDNCSIEMNIIFTLQKDSKRFSATAFPKVIGEFLGEDIYAYSNDTTLLGEKILLLRNVDFHLSNDNRMITSNQCSSILTSKYHKMLLLMTIRTHQNNMMTHRFQNRNSSWRITTHQHSNLLKTKQHMTARRQIKTHHRNTTLTTT